MNAVFLRISPVALGLLLCSWDSTAQTTDLFHRSTLTGDWNGTRNQLENSGIRLTGEYVSETAGVLHGGQEHGTRYAQQIRIGATFDLNRLLDSGRAGTLQITLNDRRGRSVSEDLIGNRLPVQEVYGGLYTRLSELSYANTLLTPDLTYKLGLMAMGNDFGGMSILTNFMNAAFCAHPLSLSGGSGWSNYPNAHFGVELSYHINDNWRIQTAVFDVNPRTNSAPSKAFKPFSSGTTGAIIPVEIIYHHQSQLPGEYKFGYYHDTSRVERIGNEQGRSSGRDGAYILADQTLWQSDSHQTRNLHLFGQWTVADKSTSPFRHWYSAGLVLNSPFISRPHDAIAIGYGRAIYNEKSRDADINSMLAQGDYAEASEASGLSHAEQLVELTYTLQATPWLSLRPSLQYIKEPGAFSSKEIKNAWVAGIQLKMAL
ncbi:carbohydrate porin [Jejubacter calystegiae]|uniref:Carbohydrate porin n=1 Tax=Jejubacter calystegiae TaxID=2579935 RepID=A0A4P8YJE1_9ENTR|nr:carbohydrate porin [Jejubacter calystegiae]QCT20871.1 carbohydrate porin [Jejubacter calystegiae]